MNVLKQLYSSAKNLKKNRKKVALKILQYLIFPVFTKEIGIQKETKFKDEKGCYFKQNVRVQHILVEITKSEDIFISIS